MISFVSRRFLLLRPLNSSCFNFCSASKDKHSNFSSNSSTFEEDSSSSDRYKETSPRRTKGNFRSQARTEDSLRLFQTLVRRNQLVNTKGLLTKTLSGVIEANVESEFVERYFDHWWNSLVAMLIDDADRGSVELMYFGQIISDLGVINYRTNGELAKLITYDRLNTIENCLVNACDFYDYSGYIMRVFSGLGNLASAKGLGGTFYLSKALVSTTINALNEPSRFLDTDGAWSVAVSYSVILENLPKIRSTLNKNELTTLLTFFKGIFDDENFDTLNLQKADVELERKVELLSSFADAFLKWQISPDDVLPETLTSWFAAGRKLLETCFDNETLLFGGGTPFLKPKLRVARMNLTSSLLKFCTNACNIATRFNRFDLLLNLKDVWPKVLYKFTVSSRPSAVFAFYNAARTTELNMKAKFDLDSDQVSKPEIKLLNADTLNFIVDKLNSHERNLADRRTQQLSTASSKNRSDHRRLSSINQDKSRFDDEDEELVDEISELDLDDFRKKNV